MAHQRKVIRDKVRDLLLGKTAAGTRVYATRVLPLRKVEVAALAVYTTDERVAQESRATAPRELTRDLSLVIEGMALATPGVSVDDALDALILQVEAVMHADPRLGGTAVDSILDTTETEIIEDGDRPMGWFALTYSVVYRDEEPALPADVKDFLRADVRQSLGGVVGEDDDVEDLVTVQEASP